MEKGREGKLQESNQLWHWCCNCVGHQYGCIGQGQQCTCMTVVNTQPLVDTALILLMMDAAKKNEYNIFTHTEAHNWNCNVCKSEYTISIKDRQKNRHIISFLKQTNIQMKPQYSTMHQNIKKIPSSIFTVIKKLFLYSSFWCFTGLLYYHYDLKKYWIRSSD